MCSERCSSILPAKLKFKDNELVKSLYRKKTQLVERRKDRETRSEIHLKEVVMK